MSGESGHSTGKTPGKDVRPEPVVEKTFVENFTGFINEVAPQTYSNPSHYEGKETISWVRFDHCDINDLAQFRDKIEVNGNSPPLLLIIGYTCGVQVWVIPVTGDAKEVLSWRQGAVRSLKVLPSPATSSSAVDIYSLKRPLIALCDSAGPGPQFCSVVFISLKTNEQVKTIKFKHPIHEIHANKNVIVISFPEKLAVFSATTLEDTFTVTTCYPCPGPSVNPVTLGDEWLAYADRRLVPLYQSCGGMVADTSTSYKATVFHAAKSLTKGLKELGESMASNLMGQRSAGSTGQQAPPSNIPTPGVVTILDTEMVGYGEINLNSGTSNGVVAHFIAHLAAPIVALEFDPTGMLLLTADKLGHNFHLYRIQPHPLHSAQAAVHHLYTLHRGDTTAKVIDISFSLDSRWTAVTTHRGTTHVFPITPYGGNIGVRTHTSSCVVNRLSRYHRSIGLKETPSSGRNSPVLSALPNSPKNSFDLSPNLAYPNPRYPPYPNPTTVRPLVQLRQPLLTNLIGSISSSAPSPSRSPPMNKTPRSPNADDIIKVASVFGRPRGYSVSSPTVPRENKKSTTDALFIMAYHGNLLEYCLEPHPDSGIPKEKRTENSAIELEVHASAQWSLIREATSQEIRPPLDPASLLFTSLSPTHPCSLSPAHSFDHDDPEERWMSQVEIHTHFGPHRRLWMGPQFSFKAVSGTGSYGSAVSQGSYESTTLPGRPPRSSPVNMPDPGGANVLIEVGSLTSNHDHSPRMQEHYSCESESFDPETIMTQLKHDLEDAMTDETPHSLNYGDAGGIRLRQYYRRLCSLQSLGPPLLGTIVIGEECGISSQGTGALESTLDMSDVMDISCDPPGPSSTRVRSSCASPSVPRVLSRPSSYVGEEVQAVTTKLHQVAVTHSDSKMRSPSIKTRDAEGSKLLTSSAEELSKTLESELKEEDSVESTWVPVDKPKVKPRSDSPEFVTIDHPKPAARSVKQSSSKTKSKTFDKTDKRVKKESNISSADKNKPKLNKSLLKEENNVTQELTPEETMISSGSSVKSSVDLKISCSSSVTSERMTDSESSSQFKSSSKYSDSDSSSRIKSSLRYSDSENSSIRKSSRSSDSESSSKKKSFSRSSDSEYALQRELDCSKTTSDELSETQELVPERKSETPEKTVYRIQKTPEKMSEKDSEVVETSLTVTLKNSSTYNRTWDNDKNVVSREWERTENTINKSLTLENEIETFDPQEFNTETEERPYRNPWNRMLAVENSSPKDNVELQESAYPALVEISSVPAEPTYEFTNQSNVRVSSKFKKPQSATTSEDDLWVSSENKKDKKKKKKRCKQTESEEESKSLEHITPLPDPPAVAPSLYSAPLSSSPIKDLIDNSMSKESSEIKSDFNTLLPEPLEDESHPLEMDVGTEYFITAEEYPDSSNVSNTVDDDLERELKKEHFVEPQPDDFQEAQESVTGQTLDDFELQNDDDNQNQEEAMLRSIHDDNDLAKALEEAYSSDDNGPVQTKPKIRAHSRSRSNRTSEMFPFKDETTDDEEQERVQLRRRLIASAKVSDTVSHAFGTDEGSTDDRCETSGDDRGESSTDDIKTGTSESDVAASPNPRANSSSKNKKKKKKKR